MADASTAGAIPGQSKGGRDIGFAVAIVLILSIFFLPVPAILIDIGIAFSIALSVLILMVSLWIQKPLEFSAFPTVLLVATLLRLALNIATTRLILSHGSEGTNAAGYIIDGFSRLVMSGDFVIGLIVFAILITVNFLVITKGATRIAEVGARFTLDAIPGKQMAIDADLSAGLIDDKQAQARRRELEEESSFFGAMDGASKFVRGDAIAGIIILAVNIFGGIIIGVTRHKMELGAAADVFTKLSVGDGLVSQIPALIVSLAAGLLVSKGSTRGSAEQAVLGQLGHYPRALFLAALLMVMLALVPGLPFLPFALLGGVLGFCGYSIPRKLAQARDVAAAEAKAVQVEADRESRESVKESLRTVEIELCLGKQLATRVLASHGELAHRVAKMRRKFARQYGFVVPEIKLTDSLSVAPKSYQIKVHGTVVATQEVRLGEMLVITGEGPKPDIPGDEVREPAFGMKALWISEAFTAEAKREGFTPVDNVSFLLTHLSEVIRNNLSQVLSYKDMRSLLDRLEPEYKRLLDDICPAQISYSGLQAVLKLLLAERVSIRNLHLILEAIAEIAPHVRRAEQVTEHVRMRMAQQICGDMADGGVLKVLRLGNRWDLAFHQALKRDAKGDVVEFDIDPRMVEQFGTEASAVIRARMEEGESFVLVAAPDARPYVRMIAERLFPTLPVLSHLEIARGVEIKALGAIFVNGIGPDTILATFLIFCRVGGCLMLMPGFSSPRVPVQVRLFVAIGVTLALAPLQAATIASGVGDLSPVVLARLFVSETTIGVLIGIVGRFFLLALETLGMAVATVIGLSSVIGPPIEEGDAMPPLVTMITFAATILIFVTDLHWELLRGLAGSYAILPVAQGISPRFGLTQIGDGVARAFFLALRISSPFIVYGLIVNIAVGILNKLTPQIPVYFISTPFVIAGGLLLLYFTSNQFLEAFVAGITGWASAG